MAVAHGGGKTSGPIDVAACLTAKGQRVDFEVETFVTTRPVAATLTRGAESAGRGGYAGRRQEDDENLVAHTLRAEGFDASEDGSGRGTPLVPVAFDARQRDVCVYGDHAAALDTDGHSQAIASGWAVRRLTPTECERLQGFPDGYTAILYRGGPAADGPRYKALGNSMAVNAMRWIGHRIEMVDTLVGEVVA